RRHHDGHEEPTRRPRRTRRSVRLPVPERPEGAGDECSSPGRRATACRPRSHGLIVSEQRQSRAGEAPSSDSDFGPRPRPPGVWRIMRCAAVLGVVLGFASLAFLGLLKGGVKLWFTLPKDPGWFDGKLWWVAVTAGTGVLVGVLRRVFRLPAKLPGTIAELKAQRVEPSTAPGAVVGSLGSLAGGASLGAEDALGKIGGGLGTWLSDRQKLGEGVRETNTLSGMSAAYGGLLTSPILATLLVLEVVRPKARQFGDTLVATLLSSSVAFAV